MSKLALENILDIISAKIKNNRIAFLAIIAILGVLGLYFYSASLAPLDVSPGDITPSHVGKQVAVTGIVAESMSWGESSSVVLAGLYTPGQVEVYIPGSVDGLPLFQGDMVELTGTVSEYGGFLELVVEEGGIELLSRGEPVSVSIPVLMDEPGLFEDIDVEVEGYWGWENISGIGESDVQGVGYVENGGARVFVYPVEPWAYEAGHGVILEGEIVYDPINGIWHLEFE